MSIWSNCLINMHISPVTCHNFLHDRQWYSYRRIQHIEYFVIAISQNEFIAHDYNSRWVFRGKDCLHNKFRYIDKDVRTQLKTQCRWVGVIGIISTIHVIWVDISSSDIKFWIPIACSIYVGNFFFLLDITALAILSADHYRPGVFCPRGATPLTHHLLAWIYSISSYICLWEFDNGHYAWWHILRDLAFQYSIRRLMVSREICIWNCTWL